MTYRYVEDGSILCEEDGVTIQIPAAEGNRDYTELMEKVANGEAAIAPYVEPQEPVPSAVSARQFKLQLLASGLLDQVEAFIASQGEAVQISYDNSGYFVRTEPMMQSGFTALGFTTGQVDQFFTSASAL